MRFPAEGASVENVDFRGFRTLRLRYLHEANVVI